MRVLAIALTMLCVFTPRVAAGQMSTGTRGPLDADRERRHHLSAQVAAGATLNGGASVVSAAFGYSPAAWLELLLNVERIHVPFRLQRFPDGYSVTRGGTMTFVSGELRLAMRPEARVSPFAMAGVGGGVSRPNVNAEFADRVRNDLRVLYLGGGVRVPLRGGFSLSADARAMLALESSDSCWGSGPFVPA